MKINGGIYKIVNVVNTNEYIGSAVRLDRRHLEHWSRLRRNVHINPYLQAAWNKYGEEAFEFRIVGRCRPELLIKLEQEVINHPKPEYNITKIAGSTLGKKPSDAARKKMSLARIGNTNSLGNRHSKETKQKISVALKGNKNAVGNKSWTGKHHTGRHHSEETKQKMREAARLGWRKRRNR